jgi:DMSO/TMAO reductase YedYZ molybdopterin-dependent catalytic subunit
VVAFFGAFVGQLVAGALVGWLYMAIVERERTHHPTRRRPLGLSRAGTLFVVLAVALLWLACYLVFGPVLGAGYTGLRPEVAAMMASEALLAAFVAYGVTLVVAYRFLTGRGPRPQASAGPAPAGPARLDSPAMGIASTDGPAQALPRQALVAGRAGAVPRRALLVGAAGGVLALASGGLIGRLYQTAAFGYDGTQNLGPHIDPITPNDRFYVVTKNIIDPHVDRSVVVDYWRFEMRGLIARPDDFNIDEIAALPSVRQATTLECISNPIGGGLISNAVWTGVPLHTLIENAGPLPGVSSVLFRAIDGYVHSLSYEKAMEPTTLLAYEMNGAPLPQRHGYPARLIVPGQYGEGSMKWITRVELVNHDEGGYYESQGWKSDYVHTISRIDQPVDGHSIALGSAPVPLAGIAFAGDRGISRVEVSLDGGRTWQEARLTYAPSRLTWALWRYTWRPGAPGTYRLLVRAADGTGVLQTPRVQSTAPMGATGYHEVAVRVVA